MVSWSNRRKMLTVLFFTFPTLVGILLLNVYPIILTAYVSFTNRNKFHPKADCSVALTRILDPLCWPAFQSGANTGLGEPYTPIEPLFKNYTDLLSNLFAPEALSGFAVFGLCFAPLVVAFYLNRNWQKRPNPPLDANLVWLIALGIGLVFSFALNIGQAYDKLINSGDFIAVVMRTILFVALRVPISFVIGLLLALILNRENLPGKTFFRVMLFVPWAASSLAILMARVWEFFFREQGTINQMLKVIGIQGPAWLSNDVTAFAAIVIADVWFSYPFFMIAILGALQGIPSDLYEAADVDGASWWTQLNQITLPLIRPAVLPATILTSISAFQMFGTAWAITQGGPVKGAGVPGATEFVIVYAYKQIFQAQNFGRATAFAVILFLFLFAVTLWSMRVSRITKGAYE
jgi:arabinogalactan oligomer/maltooligosaccharide transport system permease protein